MTVVKSLLGPRGTVGTGSLTQTLWQFVRDSGEMWREHLHNLIKLVINIHIWVKLYTFGGKYTHSGVNKSEMCSLEA